MFRFLKGDKRALFPAVYPASLPNYSFEIAERIPMIEQRDKPDEIEVTEAMLKAGALAFSSYDNRYDSIEGAAKEIFVAMLEAME